MPVAAPRLPGLRFETVRPPAPPGLPRMDVAAFVGFASAGPVGVPVAVDDEVRFRTVFGPDLPLAWDAARGESTYAHLGPAVREFFRNGGLRCWIVRVGDEAALETALFRVPGMLHGRGGRIRAAYLLASSPGSWADGMSLNAALQSALVSGLVAEPEGVRLPVESAHLLRLEWGDGTVAFFPPRPEAPERDVTAAERSRARVRPFAHARWFRRLGWEELEPRGAAPAFLSGARPVPLDPLDGWRVRGTGDARWLEITLPPGAAPGLQAGGWIRTLLDAVASTDDAADAPADPPPAADPPTPPTLADATPVLNLSVVADTPAMPLLVAPPGWEGEPTDAEPWELVETPVLVPAPSGFVPGEGEGDGGDANGGGDGGSSGGGGEAGGTGEAGGGDGGNVDGDEPLLGRRAYLLVDEVRRGEGETTVVVRQGWRTLRRGPARRAVSIPAARAALVWVELWSRATDGSVVRLPDLGLVPAHPRFVGALPPDHLLYAPAEALVQAAAGPLYRELSTLRFALAAPDRADAGDFAVDGDDGEELDGDGDGFAAYLPLGVPTVARDDFHQAAHTSARSALERDGLASYSADLFLDPLLRDESAETLVDTAFFNAYVAEPPQPPVRMHALLPVQEASLLAVPDAVHPGWRERPVEAPPAAPDAPVIETPIADPDAEGRIALRWSGVDGALGYTLEDSPDPRFRCDLRATATTVEPGRPGTHATVLRPRPCPARLYFRVSARTAAGPGGWSPAALLDLPEHAFGVCGTAPLAAPALISLTATGERLALEWAAAAEIGRARAVHAGYDVSFRVESSPEPTFSLAETVYAGPGTRAELWKPLSGALYFRAAARLEEGRGPADPRPPRVVEESPWSAARAWRADPPRRWETLAPADADDAVLRDVHQAMLRFCAGRADCFAVLALPRHHRAGDALAHAAALTAALGGGVTGSDAAGDAGARTLSFGALYHPWTVVRTPTAAAPLRAVPPDGATCGVMAARANDAGAWAAPANQPLAGVAILDPRLPEEVRAAFLGNRVNAVAPFPRGFMSWSEETLSDDPGLRGVGVRRLLILLRRLVLREGDTYVFEPNDLAFRRLVQRQFDALLGDLYVRGAFAGATHAEGYRVVTDDTVNPRESVDQGRFVVELRVAPSRPLAFLTVRLVQSGAGLTVQEG